MLRSVLIVLAVLIVLWLAWLSGSMRLGALASVDRWRQITVSPFEGPLPQGAQPSDTVSWASAADGRAARAFAQRAYFTTGASSEDQDRHRDPYRDHDRDRDRDNVAYGDETTTSLLFSADDDEATTSLSFSAGLSEADLSALGADNEPSYSRGYQRPNVVPDARGVPVDEEGNFVDVDAPAKRKHHNQARSHLNMTVRGIVKERGLDGLNGYSEEDKATATTLSQELNAKMNLQGDLRLTMQDILRTCRNVRSVNKRAANTTGVRDKRAASTSSEATGVRDKRAASTSSEATGVRDKRAASTHSEATGVRDKRAASTSSASLHFALGAGA